MRRWIIWDMHVWQLFAVQRHLQSASATHIYPFTSCVLYSIQISQANLALPLWCGTHFDCSKHALVLGTNWSDRPKSLTLSWLVAVSHDNHDLRLERSYLNLHWIRTLYSKECRSLPSGRLKQGWQMAGYIASSHTWASPKRGLQLYSRLQS